MDASASPFAAIDANAVGRVLAQLVERPDDVTDAYFERREEVELPDESEAPGLRVWRETGLAVRLVRGDETWLAGRDRIDTDSFRDAVRRVARVMPSASYPLPALAVAPWAAPPAFDEVLAFPAAVRAAVRGRQARFACRLRVRRIRRSIQLLGPRLASPLEREAYYSVDAALPWGRYGCLLTALDTAAAESVAEDLVRFGRCHEAPPPAPWKGPCVLGPAATAVLLHEAVAHALEADTLALGGHPEAAVGVEMGVAALNVLDDPSSAPEPVRRTVDDEGQPVLRRWLLRDGVVEQPLCDHGWARRSDLLAAGAGRRGDRHCAPAPRSSHLELLPGSLSRAELMADAEGGLYLPVAERGRLDPLTGRFSLHFPYGRRIGNQAAGEPVGPCTLRGQVGDLLQRLTGVGREVRLAGAGWCAKGGMKLPVWATAPALRLEGVDIAP